LWDAVAVDFALELRNGDAPLCADLESARDLTLSSEAIRGRH
jgi:hypothetical protein